MDGKKKRQHYVWKHYLKSWGKNGKLTFLMNNSIKETSVNNVANKRYFYKVAKLTKLDLLFLKIAVGEIRSDLKSVDKKWIDMFKYMSDLKSYDSINQINKIIINFEENIHQSIENIGIKYLNAIKNNDISFYSDAKCNIEFNYFIATQYTRTRKLIEDMRKIPIASGINIDAVWRPLSHILSTNMSYMLYILREKVQLRIIDNKTTINNITADQPIINTYSDKPRLLNDNELELYYPISPRKAILLTLKLANENISLIEDVEIIKKYNDLIVSNSYHQIYGYQYDDLKEYIVK